MVLGRPSYRVYRKVYNLIWLRPALGIAGRGVNRSQKEIKLNFDDYSNYVLHDSFLNQVTIQAIADSLQFPVAAL